MIRSAVPVTDREALQYFLGQPVADMDEKKKVSAERALLLSRGDVLPSAPSKRICSTTKYEMRLKKKQTCF